MRAVLLVTDGARAPRRARCAARGERPTAGARAGRRAWNERQDPDTPWRGRVGPTTTELMGDRDGELMGCDFAPATGRSSLHTG